MSRPRHTPPNHRPPFTDGGRPAVSDKDDRRATPRAGRGAGAGDGAQWLWGTHPVLAALANPARRCRRLLATAEVLRSHGAAIARLAQARPLPQPEGIERADLDVLLPIGAVHQGLALAVDPLPELQIIDLLDGCVGVVSQPGEGSTFTVWLKSAG